jgi:hypothetical protein
MNPNKKKERIGFKLINNLIVIPLTVNGHKLSFILDSGVGRTILFNISEKDSLPLNDVKKVFIQGLGKGSPIQAFVSSDNTVSIRSIVSKDEIFYVILDDYFDLSSKMGETIHGIIGYDILRNFIVKINYKSKNIDFYNPFKYKPKNCRKCETFPLEFHQNKPFIKAKVQVDTVGRTLTDVKLLVDSGGSDAIWLFENSKEEIKTPKRHFNDILGEGLSGAIYGNRSRIPKIKLGSFEIENPTVSFLDTISSKKARGFKKRNGSIGGSLLSRFIVWFNYPQQELILKKNGSFSKGFNYNMSGLEVIYNGKQLVKEPSVKASRDAYNNEFQAKNTVSLIASYSYNFKPSFRIQNVVKNSSGEKAGLLKGDIILSINNKPSHESTLNEISLKFQEKDKKKIKITVYRNGEKLKFEFRLEKKV